MSEWPIIFFTTVVNAICRIARFVAIAIALVAWFCGFIETCFNTVVGSFTAIFASLNVQGLTGNGGASTMFGTLEYIGYINAFLPVSEFVGLLAIYLTAWMGVILIRWTKSLVPTISN